MHRLSWTVVASVVATVLLCSTASAQEAVPSASIHAEPLRAELPIGGEQTFTAQVTNPAKVAQTFTVSVLTYPELMTPLDGATVETPTLTLEPRKSALVSFTVRQTTEGRINGALVLTSAPQGITVARAAKLVSIATPGTTDPVPVIGATGGVTIPDVANERSTSMPLSMAVLLAVTAVSFLVVIARRRRHPIGAHAL